MPYEENLGDRIRTDMTVDTLNFNTKEGQIIPLDDIDEERYINPYLLNQKEQQFKEVAWNIDNQEWINK